MAEVVEKTGVTKEKGYLYYLDSKGNLFLWLRLFFLLLQPLNPPFII